MHKSVFINNNLYFLEKGGEMGQLIREKDWKETSLGSPESWPGSLKTMVSLLLNNPFAMYIAWGNDYTQIYNDGYRPILGSTKHPSALGNSSKETFSEIWEIIGPMFKGVMEGVPVGFPDFKLSLNRNGFFEDCYFDFSYSPIQQEDGSVGGILVTVIETTNKKKSELALKESEEKFRSMADNIPNLAWMANADGYIYWYNQQWYSYTGTTFSEMEGWGWQSVHDPATLPVVMENWQKSIELGEKFEMIFPIKNKDGKFFQFLTRVVPVLDDSGMITQWFGTNTDITAQILIGQELKESEERFRTMAEGTDILIATSDETSNAVYFNNAWERFTGRSTKDLLNYGWADLIHEEDRQPFIDKYLNAFEKKKSWDAEFRVLNKNGEYRWLIVSGPARIRPDGNFAGYISSAVDITEQIESRKKIEETEQRARLAIESANIGTYDIDLTNDQMITSERFREIFDLSESSTRADLIKKYHPDDIGIRNKAVDEAAINGDSDYQVRLLLDHGKIKWIKCNGRVFYNDKKEPIRLVGTVYDVTPTVEIQNQKDDFLAIASHELKTPLTSVKAYTHILSNLVKNGDQVTSLNIIKKTERQIVKMTKLIHNFLDISKLETSQLQIIPSEFNLNELISETINYYNLPENKERIRFERGNIPTLFADHAKIGHVVDNFISNALKYSSPDKQIHIKTILQDSTVVLSVQDHGRGINFSSQEKIFQRFYRADNVKGGTTSGFGIGLYFSSEIIKMHKGKIWFESKEGTGSTFYFSLPYSK